MAVDDGVDLVALVEDVHGLHVGHELDRDDLFVSQPVKRHVACHRERERAHGAYLGFTRCTRGEKSRVGFLQQFLDIGGVACIAIQAGSQHAFEFQRLH